eukprot:4577750-Amphidinium_carterae.1
MDAKHKASDVHQEYQEHLCQLVGELPLKLRVVICADFNARLGCLGHTFNCVGPWTTPLAKRSHIERVLALFSSRHYYFLNTFHKPPDLDVAASSQRGRHFAVATWTAPDFQKRPAPYQIDYVVADAATASLTSTCHPLSWNEFATLHHSDHRPLMMVFTLPAGSSKQH